MMTDPMTLSQPHLAKVFAAYFAVLGFLCGFAYSIGGAIHDLNHGGLNSGTALAFLALVGMPLIAAIAGLALGFALARPVRWILRQMG